MVFDNIPGQNRAYQIQLPCVVFFAATPIFVVVRIWARVKRRAWTGLGLDDWAIVASWVFATTVMALMMVACEHGFGQHIATLSKEDRLVALRMFYLAQAFYKLTINMTKASILLLYLRIFVQRWFRATCYTLLAIVLSYMVATTSSSIWQCTPIVRAWDKSVPGTCINIIANWYANAGYSIATDIIILGLPMYPIYESHLPTGQKVALMVVFALGLFTTVTSILRMQTLHFSGSSADITYDIESSIWTIIEQNLAIICACLPVCRLPLAYLFPRQFSSSASEAKGIESSDSTTTAANTHRRSHSQAHNPRTPKRHSHPLEKGILETTTHSPSSGTGWDADEEAGPCEKAQRQHTHARSESQVTSSPKNSPTAGEPGPGIHLVRQYSITYGSKLDA